MIAAISLTKRGVPERRVDEVLGIVDYRSSARAGSGQPMAGRTLV